MVFTFAGGDKGTKAFKNALDKNGMSHFNEPSPAAE